MKFVLSQSASVSALFIVAALGIGACHNKKVFREHTVRWQDEAAAVTVSTTLVAHWDDYVSVLAPNFTLKSGDEALKKVLPRTMAIEEKVLRMFGASLGISARDYEIERPDAKKKDENGGTASTTKSNKDGDANEAEAEDSETSELNRDATDHDADDESEDEDTEDSESETATRPSAADLPGLSDEQFAVSEDDPMLEYLAATALYQEVQLLNRYIKDASLRRDYQPYVVRLQINVTPYARNMPYDVYATLSFFGDSATALTKMDLGAARRPAELPMHQQAPRSLSPVLVTPLLVTDNLEGALKSRSVNTIRDLMLALSVLTGKVDVDSKLTAYTDQLSRVLGTDLNSLLTVAQVNDNSVRVRLGAARQATAGHAMIPRTHNVTFLVLVRNDQESPKLRVEAATELRHATSGDTLNNPSLKSRKKEIHKKLKRYSKYVYPASAEWAHYCYEGLKTFLVYEYDAWIASSDFTGFEKALYSACETTTASANLWMELVELSGNRPYARASFELPEPRDPKLPDVLGQEVILTDDKKTGKMTVTLQGGRDLKKSDLFATLDLSVQRKKDRNVLISHTGTTYETYPITLVATDIEVREGRHGFIKLTFPSLAKDDLGMPLLDPSAKARVPAPKLIIRLIEDSRWKDDREPDCGDGSGESSFDRPSFTQGEPSFNAGEPKARDRVDCKTYGRIAYVLRDAETPTPQFKMTTGVDIIRSDLAGKGQLAFNLSTTSTDEIEVKLEISGAQVMWIKDETKTKIKGKKIKVKKDASKDLTVKLANLSTRSLVMVNAKVIKSDEKGYAHTPLKFWVEPVPRYRTTGSK